MCMYYRRGFVNDKESASTIMKCLVKHVMSHEKTNLQKVYLCETNDHRTKTLSTEINKYAEGIEFVDTNLPGDLFYLLPS